MQRSAKQYLAISLVKLGTAATELAYASVQLGEVQLDHVNLEIESIVKKYINAIIIHAADEGIKERDKVDVSVSWMWQVALSGYLSARFDESEDARTLEFLKGELELAIAIVTREFTKKRAHLRALHGVFA